MTPFAAWKARPGRPTLVAVLEASQGRVLAICHEILRHRHDAEEAAQETLLEIVLGIDGVRDADHFERWLTTVATRTALDRKKSRRRRKEREIRAVAANNSEPYRGLHDAIARLPDEDRELINDRYFDKKTFEEMGRQRGLSDVGVRKRIEKAHGRLKRMLGSGIVLVIGASAVKAKTAAILAVVLIPLLLLGGGVWMAAGRKHAQVVIAPAGGGGNHGASVSESNAVSAVEAPSAGPPVPTAERRRQWTLEKLREYGVTFREFDKVGRGLVVDVTPLGGNPTPPSEAALRREQVVQDEARLRQVLEEHARGRALGESWALFDPETCLEFIKTPDGLLARSALLAVIRPSMEAEISTEDSPVGPLLEGVLPYAHGSSQDKYFLLYLTKYFKVVNQAIGDVYFQLLNDPNRSVRQEALASMSEQSVKGNLKATFTTHVALLLQMAVEGEGNRFSTRDRFPGDEERVKNGAFQLLTGVGTPEIDEFLVQRMEGGELQHVQWLSISAPRVFRSHATRAAVVVRRMIDASTEQVQRYWAVRFSAQLPIADGVECLKYLGARLPAGNHDASAGLESIIARIERGDGAAMVKEMEKLRDNFWGKDFLSTFPKLSSPTAN
ncbi:MAG TPA: sigma-70 family RNA polymerase sigma factor [Planctomycetota bacterium]|nr:sigma-70 family RNA polymerase sigma factor [Planctomycetota bacterium]